MNVMLYIPSLALGLLYKRKALVGFFSHRRSCIYFYLLRLVLLYCIESVLPFVLIFLKILSELDHAVPLKQ